MLRKIFVLNSITFLAAFLLFQIELIITKILLPQYGGSYLVWGACVVFFQAALFLGYLYAHIVARKIGIKKYLPFHLGLLFLPLFFFPGRGLAQINYPNWNISLVLSVFGELCLTIGPVFFVLSTISVILQVWLADSALPEKTNPYRLYALSNLGSFVALVSYPFFFEVFFGLNQQIFIWRIAYYVLVALSVSALAMVKVNNPRQREGRLWNAEGIPSRELLRWLLFSAAAVIMFLAVTNILTYEVAPIPLLWVIPLCIYLASFVLNFKQKPWCPEWITDKFYLTLCFSVVIFFLTLRRILPFTLFAVAYCLLLFNLCMFCQRNLYQSKPLDLRQLPLFYLIISFGGFIGGFVNTWIMPVISVSVLEYLLGLVLITFAFALGVRREPLGWRNMRFITYTYTVLILWPLVFKNYNFFGIVFLCLIFQWAYRRLSQNPAALFSGIFLIFCITPIIDSAWTQGNFKNIYRHRNYYGLYKVYYADGKIFLMHGTTLHGAQFMDKKKAKEAAIYYHPHTPVGGLLSSTSLPLKNVGVIGLGSGALAAYGRPQEEFDFFELDPDVSFIAQEIFTYIQDSPAKFNFIFGDARIKIKEAQDKRYDLLIVDAFSADAIPTHLLTVEAIKEYKKHLRENGIILFHISNRYLDLAPVLFNNANYLNAYSCYKNNPAEGANLALASSWFALTWDIKVLEKLVLEFKWLNTYANEYRGKLGRPWTDDYSNLVLVMKLKDFLNSIRFFAPFYW